MSDYYTKFSFSIALTPENAQAYIDTHNQIIAACDKMDYNDTALMAPAPANLSENNQAVIDTIPISLREWVVDENLPELNLDYNESTQRLCLYSEYGDLAYVSCLIKHMLQTQNDPTIVKIQYGLDCSKPLEDAYGGGVVIVDQQGVYIVSTHHLEDLLQTSRDRLGYISGDDQTQDIWANARTHLEAWISIMDKAIASAPPPTVDQNDKSYYEHEKKTLLNLLNLINQTYNAAQFSS